MSHRGSCVQVVGSAAPGHEGGRCIARILAPFLVILIGLTMPSLVHAQSERTRSSSHQRIFDNGLQVVWEEDHRQPLVAIEVRIKGGLRGEGAYVGTGITHFLEHMLFKGTPTRPPGTIDQEVRRYGGTINAFTSMDVTGVSLFVESRYLKDALSMVADILQHAQFEQSEFDKERAVIISEIQMNLDDPDRRIHQMLWSRHFLEHPYRHPILGYQSLLERLTPKDLTAYYAAQYQPQNITMACVGDLDGTTFPDLVAEIFGGWARGTGDPMQQLVPAEPLTASAKETIAELPVQAAYVTLGFSSVRLSDPDLYPLDVLANILGDGESSRLYETLVRKRQLVHEISAWNYTPYDPGLFGVHFRTDPEKSSPAIQAVLEVIEDVKQHGVTEMELRKAKRSVSADYIFHLQTIEAKAGDFANAMTSTGDPLFSRQYVDRIAQVTKEQVQEAARRYCDATKMTTAIIHPPEAASQSLAEPLEPIAIKKATLPNGLTTIIGVDHGLPIVSIVVALHGGVRVDAEDHQGISNLVAQLLTKGTDHKNAFEIAQEVESLGGSLEPFSGRDGFGVSLQLLAQDFDEGLSLMHELITQSTFPEDELAIQRSLVLNQLKSQDDEIFVVGGRLLRRTLFRQHPYRFDPLGDDQTVRRLTRQDCLTFAKQWLVPSNMVMSVFGDIDGALVAQRLEQTFGALPAGSSTWPHALPEEPLKGVQEASQTLEKEQALIMLGFPGITHTAADRPAVEVLTAVLSGMAGRLFQSVRERYGLSYTLGAVNVPGWDPGYVLIYAATRPNEQTTVLRLLDEQLALALKEGFSDEEVEQAKRYLIGSNRMDIQQLTSLTKRCALDELYGLGADAWKTYEEKINAVTPAMVHEAAKRYLTLTQRAQVIVSPNGHR